MELQKFLTQIRSENPIYADAFLVSLVRKHRDSKYIDYIQNPVLKYNAQVVLDEQKEVNVDKSDTQRSLDFSFLPLINYYYYKGEINKIENMVKVYREDIFGDLILAIAHHASKDLFGIFLREFEGMLRRTNSTIPFILGLDEILFRFTIDEALPFVMKEYDRMDLEDKPYQIRQAAFASYAHAMKILSNDDELCSGLIEKLSIDSREPMYFKLYPLLAKNVYGCGAKELSLKLFLNLLDLTRLSIDTTGVYRFIVPPSPKSITYVLKENLKMIRELFMKIEDLARSRRFSDHEALAELLLTMRKTNNDPRALLLASRLKFISNGNLDQFVDSIAKIVKETPEDDLDVVFFDIGKTLAMDTINENHYESIFQSIEPSRYGRAYLELIKGFYMEALKVYRVKYSSD